MSEPETYIIKENEFSIDNINLYLVNIKNILIKMNIKLDSQEINKFLADSLNNSLFDNKYNKDTAFQSIMDKWDDINIGPIENYIREFNEQQKYKYYVNIEDVIYLVFYKQIKYTREIIEEVMQYLNFGVNPIYIYTFIIQSFYDDPIVTKSYMYLIGKIRDLINDEKINVFLDKEIIEKLDKILSIIFAHDDEFNKLMLKILEDRIKFIKEGIITTTLGYPNNYNCKESDLETDKSLIKIKERKKEENNKDIEVLEKIFYKQKCETLFKKRPLILNDVFYRQMVELLSSEPVVNLELWLAFILFLYKKFDFKYEEFKPKIDAIVDSKGVQFNDYKPKLDYYDDISVPKYDYSNKKQQEGGGNSYFNKYLKYKSKYLMLKIKTKIN